MWDNALKTPLQSSLRKYASMRANDFRHNMAQAMPCRAVKVDKDFVTVSFETKNKVYTLPQVKIPQSFSPYAREPTQVGDLGYAVPSDYYLGSVTGDAGGDANFYPRGNLTTLSFQPLSHTNNESRNYDQYTVAGGPQGVMIKQSTTPQSQQPTLRELRTHQRRTLRYGTAAKLAWLRRSANALPRPVLRDSSSDKAYIQIDNGGIISNVSQDAKHVITIDQQNKKITVNVPTDHYVFLGGDGKTGDYAPVGTLSGPCVNVLGRVG